MGYISFPEEENRARFDRTISEFKRILGDGNVYTDKKKMRTFASFLISADVDDYIPSAAIFPKRSEQVRDIIKICDRYKVPLWVSSTGKNIGYGAMAPCKKGSVLLSLKRMRRIIEVNQELCYALVEPGVTYKQLYEHIQKNGYKLWLNIPTGPTPVAGPVGTSLERGTGYTPYGNSFEHVCGMEIILPDGRALRTGMGGIPNSTCWQLYKWGFGPHLDGMFSQSNFDELVKSIISISY
jgi:4-cresol dehydrogenase (hydroxylating)